MTDRNTNGRPAHGDDRPVLYVLKRFPRLSETFVLRELLGLEAAGVRVLVDSLMPPEQGIRHRELDDLRAEVRYVPAHPKPSQRQVRGAHLRVAARHPVRWVALAIAARRDATWRRFLQAGMVADRIRREDVRHVHAHFATAAAEVATMAARLAGVSCSVTAHAKDIHHQDNAPHVRRRLAPADTVVTVSEANARHLRAVLSGPREARVELIHNGVALASPVDPGGSSTLLCVARLVPKKGMDVLLRATALLVRDHPDLRVTVIGTGPLLADLLELRRDLGLDDTVEFAGAATSSEVKRAMDAARAVVLACRVDESGDRDGMPTVLVEALAAAVPVISTDVPGIGELVRDHITGLLVPADDDAALAQAMRELLDSPELARRLGRAGRDLVGSDFSPADATRRLLEVFGGCGTVLDRPDDEIVADAAPADAARPATLAAAGGTR
jgi:glycosyltransferase involved in cell wall biosynthesis